MKYLAPNFKKKNQLKKMMTQRDKIYYNIASNTKIEEQNLDKQNIFIKLIRKAKTHIGLREANVGWQKQGEVLKVAS